MKFNPLIVLLASVSLIGGTAAMSYSLARKATIDDFVARGLLSSDAASLSGGARTTKTSEVVSDDGSVAEVLYQKARVASESGEWLAVKALLENSPAVSSVSYEQYASAVLLLAEASNKVAGIEARVADELQALRDEAVEETAARKAAEEATQAKAVELSATKQQKEEQEAALIKKINQTEEEKQAALKKAQDEANAAFINELDVYVELMREADGALRNAESEADAGRDVQSIVYVKQAEGLFTQVQDGAAEARNSRTPVEFNQEITELLRAVGIYKTAAKHYRTMIAELPGKGDVYEAARVSATNARREGETIVNARASTVVRERNAS